MAALVTGFVASTIGFSVFLYGKKQGRMPQLLAGMLLMVLPLVLPSAAWTAALSAIVVGGLWLGLRAGW